MGEVIVYPNRTRENYAWVLRNATSNQDELWSLWMVVRLLNQRGAHKILALGVFQVIINKAYTNGGKDTETRHSLWHRTHSISKRFSSIHWSHILKSLSQCDDSQANKEAKQRMGELIVNGTHMKMVIPP